MASFSQLARRRVSLTVRFSALLILAAVIPLLITVGSSLLILSPALTNQAIKEMRTDAMKRSDNIDSYLEARMQELTYMSQFSAIQSYLAQPGTDSPYYELARQELTVSHSLDSGYSNWTLYKSMPNAQGKSAETAVLSYPLSITSDDPDAKIPQSIADLLKKYPTRSAISDVYYDANYRQAYVDLYTTVRDNNGKTLGIERASLMLSTVWDAVNNEYNAGTRDYAMVVDSHDVCIAYTSTDTTGTTLPDGLFKATAPLPSSYAKQVSQELLYNTASSPLAVTSDSNLTSLVQNTSAVADNQFQPTGQGEKYEVVKSTGTVLPWSYIVFRPMSTITSAANQQLVSLFIIAIVVTLVAAIAGLFVSRGIARPIQRSVSTLRGNSDSLKSLASAEQSTVMEQKWIIDSSQVGLKDVQYYANATSTAAKRLNSIGENLLINWNHIDSSQVKRGLDDMLTAARYIDKAADHQRQSCGGLNDAIQVTVQVTDQLVTGATSANDAAGQLDTVVAELREVVGK